MMNNYENKILDAIKIIVDDTVNNANFDKTIQGTVQKIVDETIGKYLIKYQDSAFFAYSTNTNTTYPVGTSVYVLIPNSDMSSNKTIIGSVNKLGIDYVNNILEEEKYNKIGNNIIKNNGIFELCSYKNRDYKELYNKEENINLLNLNIQDAEIYLSNSNFLYCGASFKTNLATNQKFKGNYGITFDILYSDNSTGEDILRTYTIDIDNMSGNPYSFDSFTKQYAIYNIDNENFKSIEKINIFSENFPYQKDTDINDIFVNNIFMYGAEALTNDELSNCALSFITPQGIYFDNKNIDTDIKTIEAEVKIKGKIIDKDSQLLKYYWFKENASINKDNLKYNKVGGNGWECLNEYNLITEDSNTFAQWNTNKYKISLTKTDVLTRVNKYKCVVVYNDSNIITKEIIIYNFDCDFDITIHSDNGINFYFDEGSTNLTCLINNQEYNEDIYEYSWGFINYSGLFSSINEKSNKLSNILAKDIINSSIYKCAVFKNKQYIGTASLTLYNYLESQDETYHLILNNSTAVYKYNEAGISPASQSLDKPISIMPLNFTLYDTTGKEISLQSLSKNAIKWIVPNKNTMIKISDIYGEPDQTNESEDIYFGLTEIGYEINNTYNTNYNNNTIKLSVEYDGNTYIAITNFTFIKEGNIGTNGTDFICKIIPNTDNNNFYEYPTVIYNKELDNFKLNYNNKGTWFLVQLWKNGEKIFEGANSGSATDGQNIEVEWSNLLNNYSNLIKDNTNFKIDSLTGEITFDSTEYDSPSNIIKCQIKYLNNIYYATIPIILVRIKNDSLLTKLKYNTGFMEVVYNNNGKLPNYNNNNPFELITTQKISENEEIDISNVDNNYQIFYNWEIKGKIYIDGWLNEKNLIEQTLRNGLRSQKKYSPIDSFNGMCVSNALYCSIVREGEELTSIHIPIQFYLNRYENSLINQWDGNSISIREDEGMILSPQVGAGKKESDNSFTGVFMGSVQEKANQNIESGLFGYEHGERTFLLNAENGMASFGKTGAGQIIIDPTTGGAILKSGNYDEEQKTGMLIDLSKPSIKYANGNFSVDENGTLSAKELTTISDKVDGINDDVDILDKSIKKFVVSSGVNTILIPVDENHYPLENQSYTIEIFAKYIGEDVNPTVSFDKIISGINRNYRNNILTFSVSKDTPIEEVSNIITATFTYTTENDIELTDTQQYNISLAVKGSQGVQGTPGIDGENGKTTYFHVKYAPVINPSSSQMTETPDKFIGTYVDFIQEDSVDPNKYTWSKFQGEDGIPGTNGENGQTSYLHIKYSNDGGKTFTSNNGEMPGEYIGQYTDFNIKDSLDVNDYIWALIKGEDGESSYTFFRYSSSANGANMTTLPQADTKYIGIANVIVNQAPTQPSAYTWTLIKGENGETPYFAQLTNENHTFAYGSTKEVTTQLIGYYGNTETTVTIVSVNGISPSTSYKNLGITGLTFKVDSTAAKNRPTITFKPTAELQKGINEQIPIAYKIGQNLLVYTTNFSASSSVPGNNGTNAKLIDIISTGQVFTWDLNEKKYTPESIRLTPVLQGGISYSNWKYSTNNGDTWINLTDSLDGITTNLNGEVFISNNSFITESNINNYSLRCYSSDSTIYDTISIIKIKDGIGIKSTEITYQQGNSGTSMPTGNWSTTIPTVSPGKYLWTKTVFTYSDASTKTMYSVAKQGSTGSTGNGIKTTEITYQTSSSGTSAPTGEWTTTIPNVLNGQYLWTKTYITYTNGTDSTSYSVSYKGTNGTNGTNGISPYNVILTNESQTIAGGTTSAKATTITTNVLGYQGATKVNTSIGTISGLPTGMTASITNNNTQNTSITFKVTTSMTSPNGQITIPVTVGSTTINKIFSYSISFTGSTGAASREYFIEADVNVVIKGQDDKLTPSNITFKSYYTTGLSTTKNAYSGTWWIQYTTNGTSWTNIVAPSTTNASSKTITVTSAMRQIRAYLGPASTTPTTANAIDVQTIPVLTDIDNISIGGRNYLIKNNWVSGNWDLSTGELKLDYQGRLAYSEYIEVIPGETYCTQLINNKDTEHNILCRTYDENKIKNGSIAPMQTIYTIPENVKYLTFTIYDDVELSDITNNLLLPKFEKGNKPTDWTPAPEDSENMISENSILSIENQYCYGSSLSVAPEEEDSGWTSGTPSSTTEKKYMWARVKYTYLDGTIVYTSYSCLATENKYLKDQITEYILSSSNKTIPSETAAWMENKPSSYVSTTPYLWLRTKTIYAYENSFLNDEIVYCDYRLDTSWNKMFDLNEILTEQVKAMQSSLNGIVKIQGDTIMIGNKAENPTDVIVMNSKGVIFYKNTHSGWPTSADLASVTATLTIDGKFNADTIQVNNLTANNISNQNLVLGKSGVQGQLVVNNFDGSPVLEVDSSQFKVYKYDATSGAYKGYVLITGDGFQEYNEGDQLIFGNNSDNEFYGEKIKTEELTIQNADETFGMKIIPVEITIGSIRHKGIGII